MGCGPSQQSVGAVPRKASSTISPCTVGPGGEEGVTVSSSYKTPRLSQFLDKGVAASWRANHTVSIRANLVQTRTSPIEDDYSFELEKEIGRGGVGFVVIGESKELKDLFAIKVCDKTVSSLSRLSREILLLKDVDHINIIRLFRVYDVPLKMYFVMELCDGNHLGALLKTRKEERLDEAWSRRLCRQLMSAISHMHSRGICHRDIKLQNILLDSQPVDQAQIKVIDFGYGSRFIGALPMRSKVGTPYTIAPEVLRESYDQRCDVWSAAVVLFILLSGKRPFEPLDCVGPLTEAGKAAMTTNILSGRFHFQHHTWSTVSDDAIKFVSLLFTQPYTERIEASEALEDPWLRAGRRSSVSVSLAENSLSNNVVANIMNNLDESTPALRRTGNVALAFGFQPEEASKMRSVFQTVDTDGSGGLDQDEFCVAMQVLCPSLTVQDCQLIFTAVDANGDGQISYTEFLAASLDPRTIDVAELNKAFRLLDANGDGYISAQELSELYSLKLNVPKKAVDWASVKPAAQEGCLPPSSDSENGSLDAISLPVLEMMAACDHDKDGRISYEEFIWGMTGQWIRELIAEPEDFERKKSQDLNFLRGSASASQLSVAQSDAAGCSNRQPHIGLLPPSAIDDHRGGRDRGDKGTDKDSLAEHLSERSARSLPTPLVLAHLAPLSDDQELSMPLPEIPIGGPQ